MCFYQFVLKVSIIERKKLNNVISQKKQVLFFLFQKEVHFDTHYPFHMTKMILCLGVDYQSYRLRTDLHKIKTQTETQKLNTNTNKKKIDSVNTRLMSFTWCFFDTFDCVM